MFKVFLLVIFSLISTALMAQKDADLIIINAKIATMVKANEFREAVAVKNGLIEATGSSKEMLSAFKNANTRVIDAKGQTIVPGLNDSHMHIIREGLHFNSELRWDGVKTLKKLWKCFVSKRNVRHQAFGLK